MAKRLDVRLSAIVPDDVFAQGKILAAAKEHMDNLVASMKAAITEAGGDSNQVHVDTKVVSPTPGRTRKKNSKAETAPAGRSARAA